MVPTYNSFNHSTPILVFFESLPKPIRYIRTQAYIELLLLFFSQSQLITIFWLHYMTQRVQMPIQVNDLLRTIYSYSKLQLVSYRQKSEYRIIDRDESRSFNYLHLFITCYTYLRRLNVQIPNIHSYRQRWKFLRYFSYIVFFASNNAHLSNILFTRCKYEERRTYPFHYYRFINDVENVFVR